MKIIIWVERFFPEIGGLEYSMYRLAQVLRENEHEVTILTSSQEEQNFPFDVIRFDHNNFIEESTKYLLERISHIDVLYISRLFQGKEGQHIVCIEKLKGLKIYLRVPTTKNILMLEKKVDFIRDNVGALIVQNKDCLLFAINCFKNTSIIYSPNRGLTVPSKKQCFQSYFIFSGRITESKNLYTLLEAWEVLLDQTNLPRMPILKVFGTPYDKEYFKKCVVKISKLKNVEYYGSYHPENFEHIINSSCVVIPSLREGHSNLFIQSSLAGKPCIYSNIPGLGYNKTYNDFLKLNNPLNKTELFRALKQMLFLEKSEYESLSEKILKNAKFENELPNNHFEHLCLGNNTIGSRPYTGLFVKPESASRIKEIVQYLLDVDFEVVSLTKFNSWLRFSKGLYTDLQNDHILSIQSYYDNNVIKDEFYFIVLFHRTKLGQSHKYLKTIKGNYFANKLNSKSTLRYIFGKPVSENIIVNNKEITLNGFHSTNNHADFVKSVRLLKTSYFCPWV